MFGCYKKSDPETIVWKESATAVIEIESEVPLELLHYNPEYRPVGALEIP